MHDGILDIGEHNGEGYKPLVDFGAWRVAILRFEEGLQPGQQSSMERHMETDEVFVLTHGEGAIILGGKGGKPVELACQRMESGKVYNIRKSTWHTVSLSRDASVLIVENQDTRRENSEYVDITDAQRQWIAQATCGETRIEP